MTTCELELECPHGNQVLTKWEPCPESGWGDDLYNCDTMYVPIFWKVVKGLPGIPQELLLSLLCQSEDRAQCCIGGLVRGRPVLTEGAMQRGI
jgi:hypothetical protein